MLKATQAYQAELRAQITALRAQLAKLEELYALTEEVAGHKTAFVQRSIGEQSPWRTRVKEAIERTGKAMTVAEIMAAIEASGYRESKSRQAFYANVYSILTRGAEFERLSGNRWQCRDIEGNRR